MWGSGGHGKAALVRKAFEDGVSRDIAREVLLERFGESLSDERPSQILRNVYGRTCFPGLGLS